MATINVATLSGEHCTTNFTAYDYVYVAIWGRGRFCALLFCHYWKTAFSKAAISHTIMALQFLNGGGGGIPKDSISGVRLNTKIRLVALNLYFRRWAVSVCLGALFRSLY